MSGAGIQVEALWKSYRSQAAGSRTLRGVLSRRVPLLSGENRRWALRGVGLEVEPGETVGVIGPNGAGKSTLLRLVAGLGTPDRGRVRLPEATTAVLSLGDTVDLSLTGRENAITAAIVAGMSRSEARARMGDVFEFAELEAFADAPVRTYSEGMKLRLAFGVVAQLEPRALLVDEVLSVGDLRFQARCAERISELKERGTAILLTSHYLEEIAAQCERAVWLHAGVVRQSGSAGAVIEAYERAMRSETIARTPAASAADSGPLRLGSNRLGSQEVTIDSVGLVGAGEGQSNEIMTGGRLSVELRLTSRLPAEVEVVIAVAIRRARDGLVCVDVNSERGGMRISVRPGDRARIVSASFERLDLAPGDFRIDVGVYRLGWEFAYDYHWAAYPLRVRGDGAGDGVLRQAANWGVE